MMKKIALMAALAAASAGANAALFKVSFEGTRSPYYGTWPSVFGSTVPTLSGHAIYESTTPGTLWYSAPGHTSYDYHNAVRELSVTLRGEAGERVFSGVRSEADGFATIRVMDGHSALDSFTMQAMTLSAEHVTTGAPAYFRSGTFYLGLMSPTSNAIDTHELDLLTGFDPNAFSRQQHMSFSVSLNPGAPSGQLRSFNYNFDVVSISEVTNAIPEPASLALLGLGSLSLAAVRRRAG